ncbi:hypothetical protein [Kitasatospora aureofaciens]|uniref:hypothetical protein n=1 Tax=Kitasatospora aureofaciens TaxID=1894 RepID=UPI000AF35B03
MAAHARRRRQVPPRARPPRTTDKTIHGELISWLDRQRYLNGQGLLDAARVSELDALGMIRRRAAGMTLENTAAPGPARRG